MVLLILLAFVNANPFASSQRRNTVHNFGIVQGDTLLCIRVISVSIWPAHFKFLYQIKRPFHIKSQWFELFGNINVSLLRELFVCDLVQVCERFVQKCGYVVNFLQNLRIIRSLNKLDQLFENCLNCFQLCSMTLHELLLVNDPLLFLFEFLLEPLQYFVLFLVKFSDQLRKAFLNVCHLQFHEPFQFVANLRHQHSILVNDSLAIIHQFSQINHILLQ